MIRWLLAASVPSPSPSGGMRPGLEETDVSPGLVGFLVTFAVAGACVLLFMSFTKHLRAARRNAQEQGLPVEENKGIGFRREDGPAYGPPGGAPGGGAPSGGAPGGGPSDGGGSPSSSGGRAPGDGGGSSSGSDSGSGSGD
ncbi:hypothetical protein [Antribacter gilvus]|uniref:hypothetical protein n=1 Tax=Antribacter gilvus TaxID=2304675 RepID=UPI0013E07816|nr:hypothetical protein [Antribacter gilvus]